MSPTVPLIPAPQFAYTYMYVYTCTYHYRDYCVGMMQIQNGLLYIGYRGMCT